MSKQQLKTNVPALDRTIQILDYVGECGGPPLASDIAKNLTLPKSSAHAHLAALVDHGLLYRNSDMRYVIGGKTMRWTNAFLTQQDIVGLFMQEIVTQPELSLYSLTLTSRDVDEVVCLACHNGSSRLGFVFHMGLRLPIVFAATGKAMLSTQTEEYVRNTIDVHSYEPLTPHAVKDIDELCVALAEARKRGYSLDDREVCDGMLCIGAPVYDYRNNASYGVAISMQKAEADETTIARIGSLLRACADRLSTCLGATP